MVLWLWFSNHLSVPSVKQGIHNCSSNEVMYSPVSFFSLANRRTTFSIPLAATCSHGSSPDQCNDVCSFQDWSLNHPFTYPLSSHSSITGLLNVVILVVTPPSRPQGQLSHKMEGMWILDSSTWFSVWEIKFYCALPWDFGVLCFRYNYLNLP